MDIRFLVQLADGRWRHLAAPQSLGNILHTPDGYSGQVHLDEAFFYAAFTTAIPLYDSGLKGDSFELGYLQSNVPGSGSEVPAVVAAAIALTLLIALVPGRLGQLLRFSLQQFVKSFLYAASYQLLDLTLDYFFVKLYNLLRYGLLSPFRMVCRNFILPEFCKPCLFLATFLFAKNIIPYPLYRQEQEWGTVGVEAESAGDVPLVAACDGRLACTHLPGAAWRTVETRDSPRG